MVRINWELEPGEKIEEFEAALLLLRHPGPGNRITPSRGDRGVDVRLIHPDGTGFFQVKRHSRPLTSAQKTQTEKSWTTFFAETAPYAPVKSWTLVCPWNPSNEALEWLETLTFEAQFPMDWMGRAGGHQVEGGVAVGVARLAELEADTGELRIDSVDQLALGIFIRHLANLRSDVGAHAIGLRPARRGLSKRSMILVARSSCSSCARRAKNRQPAPRTA